MSEKLPDGWFNPFQSDLWQHPTGAAADLHRPHGNFRAAVYGPDRTTKEEAEQDRLKLIAGLECHAGHISAVEVERDAALAELATLKTRCAGDRAEHLATLHEIGRALNAYLTADGVTVHYGTHEIANAVRAQGKALHEAMADRLRLIKELDAARERDTVSQLLRDSMRVTQEESSRLRADFRKVTEERDALLRERPNHRLAGVFEMQDRLVEAAANAERQTAEIAALRQRLAASEAYAQHLLAALNLRTLP